MPGPPVRVLGRAVPTQGITLTPLAVESPGRDPNLGALETGENTIRSGRLLSLDVPVGVNVLDK